MPTITDTSLVTFKAISTFSISLEEIFGKKQRPLKLYVRLLKRTTLSHEKAIKKHVDAFREFCIVNREALEQKDASKFLKNKIIYSERVFIDIKRIFKASDKETAQTIWEHLLTIAALLDPAGKARKILKQTMKTGDGSEVEANFLTDIIGKVEKHVDADAEPMQAVASIMQSGVFSELVSGMGSGLQDGSLDLSKLMGTVQSMVSGLNQGSEGLNSSEGLPDLSGLMNMVTPMLGALTANLPVTEQTELASKKSKSTIKISETTDSKSKKSNPSIYELASEISEASPVEAQSADNEKPSFAREQSSVRSSKNKDLK